MSIRLTDICSAQDCTGCMACLNACSHAAITMVTDSLGFRYPKKDSDKCINCGLCEKVCPQLNETRFSRPVKCYAAAIKPENTLLSCASGGAATALAVHTVSEGGIVAGCSGNDMHNVRHTIAETIAGLEQFKGSKYVQSEIPENLYRTIRSYLLKGRRVLFVGTGCQVAGLRGFLGKDYENLVTADLVCHGVPSQQLLDDNIKQYKNIDANSITFRYKKPRKTNFIRFALTALTHNGGRRITKPWYSDPYMGAFIACESFRDCCYSCRYARPERQSDLTLCDFWGLGKDSRLAGSTGVSAVIVNTPKGQAFFNKASDILDFEERTVEEAVKGNGQLQYPSPKPADREKFVKIYASEGIRAAYRATARRRMIKKHLKTKIYPLVRVAYRIVKALKIR